MSNITLQRIDSQNKTKVIQLIREITGWGLAESQAAVDQVESGTPFTIQNIPTEQVSDIAAQFEGLGCVLIVCEVKQEFILNLFCRRICVSVNNKSRPAEPVLPPLFLALNIFLLKALVSPLVLPPQFVYSPQRDQPSCPALSGPFRAFRRVGQVVDHLA